MEMSTADAGNHNTQSDSSNPTTQSPTDANEDSSNTQSESNNSTNNYLLGDKEIIPEVNPDLTPVVLLDKDERTQEQWTGHYQKENGDLLCGREYTKAVPDPQRDHYSEVCMDCLQERPGALSEEDITSIFEKITGSEFTDDLPILLDRKKAAEVISVIAANEGK
jgi:hypothetical protein